MHRIATAAAALVLLAAPVGALADSANADGMQAIDACGVLVQGAGCVLFEGGGGTYVVVNVDDFQFGDAVRVVGTVDPECVTICPEADGCIRGAAVYDPAVFPCGTDLPNLPADIVTDACTMASGVLVAGTVAGLMLARPRRPVP